MQDAQTNAKNLIDDAKKEAEYVVEKSMLDARQAAEKILSDTKIQIEAQRLAMQKRLEGNSRSGCPGCQKSNWQEFKTERKTGVDQFGRA